VVTSAVGVLGFGLLLLGSWIGCRRWYKASKTLKRPEAVNELSALENQNNNGEVKC
jgi:hypothetical protein